jgi:DNA-binding transcriptional regulator YiaG
MTIVEITGGMLRAARSLAGLSQQELADRGSISRRCLTAWEGSSGSVLHRRRAHNFTMTLIRVTGSQLHAARVLVGLSREVLAEPAGLCRHTICKWETSSHAVRGAMCGHLCRVVDVLNAAMGQRTMRRAPSPNYRMVLAFINSESRLGSSRRRTSHASMNIVVGIVGRGLKRRARTIDCGF